MIKPWRIRRAASRQRQNLVRLCTGRTVSPTSLGSMTLDADDVKLVRQWLKRPGDWYNESVVQEYQQAFAEWNASKHAFAFMGGRIALSACLEALELGSGDEVVLPGYTCVVVPNALRFASVTPRFNDIEIDTYGSDVKSVAALIGPSTRAILIHHLHGLVCRDYEQLLALAKDRGIVVIEDCAQAMGAEFRGVRVGNRGTLGFYSTEQSKIMNTIQGGVAVTGDSALASRLNDYWQQAPFPDEVFIDKLLHNVILNYYSQKHPQRWLTTDLVEILYGDKTMISTSLDEQAGKRPSGYGARMPAPVAALGLNQLRKIDRYNEQRRETAARWESWCREAGYQPPTVLADSLPVFLRYPILVSPDKKANGDWAERELGVQLGRWFISHTHPTPSTITGCPNADIAIARSVNLPGLVQ